MSPETGSRQVVAAGGGGVHVISSSSCRFCLSFFPLPLARILRLVIVFAAAVGGVSGAKKQTPNQ